jgi:hypothetical protein
MARCPESLKKPPFCMDMETSDALAAAILANGDGEFWKDVATHVGSGGYFYAGGGSVLLWRPVWSHWPREWWADASRADPHGDAWFVWSAAGKLTDFLAMVRSEVWPPKKYVAFFRRGRAVLREVKHYAFQHDGVEQSGSSPGS